MLNRLAQENSPYLLQHAQNPVDWYPWGPEALAAARRQDKPIFLSIGYAACHWCHVMAHESFEDPRIAALMNENFINIKVDREERPDLDAIYMNAVVAMTGQGGWPMSVFLTPELKPFFGGTYFPPRRRHNMPSFEDVLEGVAHTWRQDRQRLVQASEELAHHLQNLSNVGAETSSLAVESLDRAAMHLAQAYDWQHGGWGGAPMFPQPMAIEFLLLRAAGGDRLALDMAAHALRSMARGGMYDVVGGGFARYSTDDRWLVPHFEKMLYDNAQLARAYLHGYLLTEEAHFRLVCEATLDFICRELMAASACGDNAEQAGASGGFFSSLDADSEGEEGKFYVWAPEEIQAALPSPQEAEFILAAYGVTGQGNFEGRTVLSRAMDDEGLSRRFNLPVEQVPARLASLHSLLLEARSRRVRPATDDKVLVAWNALAVNTFAEAARFLGRLDYLNTARRCADFLLTELNPKDRLMRSWRQGKAQHNAYLEDYAALILGLLSLYQTDPDPYWYSSALQLTEELLAHFTDPEGGFFDTRDDQGDLLLRPKDVQDNATPSGSSLAAQALLQMALLAGRDDWRDMAEKTIGQILLAAEQYPTAFSNWLCAANYALAQVQEIAILGDPVAEASLDLQNVVWEKFRPHAILAVSPFPPPETAPALLKDRPLLDGRPTAYVCRHFVCQRPVTSPEDLRSQLE